MALNIDYFVSRTPRDVWKIATEWGIAEYWLGVSKLRMMEQGKKPGVGAKLIYDVRGQSHLTTITIWEPPNRLGLESTQGGVTAHYEYHFTQNEDGRTRLQLEAKCTAEGAVWKFFLPFISWMMERADRKQLEALGKLVEMTTPAPPT